MNNHQTSTATASAVTGIPRIVLRFEGAALLIVATLLFVVAILAPKLPDAQPVASWWLFIILFLVPDLSFLGYLGGARIGAIAYNAAHTLIGPLLLLVINFAPKQLLPIEIQNQLVLISLIWIAHIGFDRMLGYGLKYSVGFKYTHLGYLGRASSEET